MECLAAERFKRQRDLPPESVSSRNITATYAYDALSRLTGVSAGDMNPTPGCTVTQPLAGVAWASAAVYNPAGQMTGLKRFAGCSGASETYQNEAWKFNSMNQVTEIDRSAVAANPGPATTAFMTYAYPAAGSNNGQVSSTTDSRLGYSVSYTYDYLRRLTQANAGTHWNQTYTYDGFGNLTGKSVPAGSAEPVMPGVDANTNRSLGAVYDFNGNATTVNAFTLAYDMENRMVSATSGSAVESYAYDPANHRVEKKIGTTQDYVYFWGLDGRLLATYSVTGSGSSWQTSIVRYRIYLGKMLAGQTSLGYGNAVPMEDRLGTVTAGYPYGTGIQAGTGVESDVDFATYSKDSMTGFEYANQRYYLSGWGRFLSADRSTRNFDLLKSGSWNRSLYANGDPNNNNDPTGLYCAVNDDGSTRDYTDNSGDDGGPAYACSNSGSSQTVDVQSRLGAMPTEGWSSWGYLYLADLDAAKQSYLLSRQKDDLREGIRERTREYALQKCADFIESKYQVSLVLDVLGSVPGSSILQMGLGVVSTVYSASSGDAAGALGSIFAFQLISLKPVAAAAGWRIAKTLPVVGNVFNIASLVRDLSNAYGDYRTCLTRY